MKTYLFASVLILSALLCNSQVTTDDYASKIEREKKLTKHFLTFGTGINANFGFLGWGVELPLSQKISIAGGVGLSGWGFKGHGEIKLYFKENYEGFSIGIGLGRNSGLEKIDLEMETEPDKKMELVTLNLKPLNSVSLGIARTWRLGKSKRHRIFIQSGIVVRTTDSVHSVISDHELSTQSVSILRTLAPGGLILGGGFSFGL